MLLTILNLLVSPMNMAVLVELRDRSEWQGGKREYSYLP